MNKLKLQVPVGTGDYLPDECAEKRRIENDIRIEFQQNGYSEIETPSFEYYDVFMHDAVQYVQENMIKFFDSKGRILALRPDMTGPIARMAATKLASGNDVLRLCYVGNVYGFKSMGGKTEYTQAGVELIGKSGAEADAEVIALAVQALRKVGLSGFKIDIGQVSYFKGLLEDVALRDEQIEKIRMLIDSKNNVELEYELTRLSIGQEVKESLTQLSGLFGGREVLERAKSFAKNESCKQAVENIQEVYNVLCDFGFAEYISIDFGMLNNFNYYSGITFRGIADGVGVPILSGGRYDGLLQEFGVNKPATGFAIGIKELLIVLEKQQRLNASCERVTVIKCTPEARRKAYQYAQQLRALGKHVVIETNGSDYDAASYDVVIFQ